MKLSTEQKVQEYKTYLILTCEIDIIKYSTITGIAIAIVYLLEKMLDDFQIIYFFLKTNYI